MAQSEDEISQVVVACGEVLDVAGVAELKTQLQQQLLTHRSIVLDAGQLTRIDCAGLQLLAALFQDAGQSQCDLSWQSPSESLRAAADISGLKHALNL